MRCRKLFAGGRGVASLFPTRSTSSPRTVDSQKSGADDITCWIAAPHSPQFYSSSPSARSPTLHFPGHGTGPGHVSTRQCTPFSPHFPQLSTDNLFPRTLPNFHRQLFSQTVTALFHQQTFSSALSTDNSHCTISAIALPLASSPLRSFALPLSFSVSISHPLTILAPRQLLHQSRSTFCRQLIFAPSRSVFCSTSSHRLCPP